MPTVTYQGVDHDLVILEDVTWLTVREEDAILASAAPAARPGLAKTLAQIRATTDRLLAGASHAQRSIGFGHYAALKWNGTVLPAGTVWDGIEPPWTPGETVTIYGHIYTRAQFHAREQAAGERLRAWGAEPDQSVAASMAHLNGAFTVGWRYGQWYSQVTPEGEPGENHVGHLIPITPGQFKAARAAGWPAEIPAG